MKRIALALVLAGLSGCAHRSESVYPATAEPAPVPTMSVPPPPPPAFDEARARALEAQAREQAQQRERADARAAAERRAAMQMAQARQQMQARIELPATASPSRPGTATRSDGASTPALPPMQQDGAANPGSAATDTDTEVVDEILSQLTLGKVAFNTPRFINIEETVSIHVALSPSEGEAVLLERVEGPGEKVASDLQVGNNMEARLSGEGFKIVPVTRERQAVASGVTEWIWDVTPLRAGKHQLTLTIDALISVNGQTIPKTLRTFRKPIEVDVTVGQRLGGWLSEHGKWAWTTLLLPLFGWVAKKRKAKAAGGTPA